MAMSLRRRSTWSASAQCPHCGVEFKLRREKSVEYLREVERHERKQAEFWFKAAIAAAAFVGFVLLVMFGVMMLS